MLTKQEADKLIKETKGESRGVNIKIDLDYVLEKEGKEALLKVENKLKKLEYPLKKQEIDQMAFYPLGLEALVILCIKDVLSLDKDGLEEMGRKVVKFSILMKILMKYFGSLALVAKEVPKTWKKHYTIGSLEVPDFSEKKRYIVLRQKGFKVHPAYCSIHKGYLLKAAEMVIKAPGKCKETKCIFKGEPYNEFLITW